MAITYVDSGAGGYPRTQMARTLARPRTPTVAPPGTGRRPPNIPVTPQVARPPGYSSRQTVQPQPVQTYQPLYATSPNVPRTGAATQPTPTSQPQGPGYTYQADPVIQRIQALSRQNYQDAQANAEAARKQVLLDYGDEGFAREYLAGLGQTPDATFLQGVGGNAFGIRQQLQRSREQETRAAEDRLNKANLFYSGSRGLQLGELGQTLLQRENDALGDVKGRLAEIAAGLLSAQQQAAYDDASAYTYGEAPGGYYPPPAPPSEPPPTSEGGTAPPPPPPPPLPPWAGLSINDARREMEDLRRRQRGY